MTESIDSLRSANNYLTKEVTELGRIIQDKDAEIILLNNILEAFKVQHKMQTSEFDFKNSIMQSTINDMNEQFSREKTELIQELTKLKLEVRRLTEEG